MVLNRLDKVSEAEAALGAMVVLALASLLAALGTSVANIALSAIAGAFDAPFGEVQLVVVAYLVALTIAVVAAGRLGDRYGLKRMLVGGLGLFSVASLICAVAPSLWVLVTARALQGLGAAFLMTLSMALMRQTARRSRIGRAMGLLGTVSALGTALGPSLGGFLIPIFGWQSIFWIQLPLGLVTLVLAMITLPGHGPRNDGAVSKSLRSPFDRAILPNLIVSALVAAVMMTTLVVGPVYLGTGLRLDLSQVGLVMTIGPVISIVTGMPSGRLVDALGSALVLTIGLSLMTAGAVLLAFLPNMVGVAGYIAAVLILTPGYQLFQAANNVAALADIAADNRGTVSGMLALSRNIGLIVGASFMGAVFAIGAATQDLPLAMPAAIASGMQLTFLVAGAMTALGMGLHLAVRKADPA